MEAHSTPQRGSALSILPQWLQLIFLTILATLHFTGLLQSPTLNCSLATRWQELFSAHDGGAIRRIQDTLECCGFKSVVDREWPFHRSEPIVRCAERFGRAISCAGPWRRSLQRTAGVELTVVIIAGVIQVGYPQRPRTQT